MMLRRLTAVRPVAFRRRVRPFFRASEKNNEVEVEVKEEKDLANVGYGDAAPRPDRVLSLGLTRRPLFPGMVHSLTLSAEATRAVAAERQAGRPYLGVFFRKETAVAPPSSSTSSPPSSSSSSSEKAELLLELETAEDPLDVIFKTGTFAQVHSVQETPDGNSHALLLVHRRCDFETLVDLGPPPRFGVEHWPKEVFEEAAEDDERSDLIRALSNEVVATIRELVQVNPLYREHMNFFTQRVDIGDPYKLADFAAALATGEPLQLQKALEARDVVDRLRLALELVSKERELGKLQQEISKQVEEKITAQQRTFMLHEQLKAIKKELGVEQDDKDALVKKYEEKVKFLDEGVHEDEDAASTKRRQKKEEATTGLIPKEAKAAIDEELAKLRSLEKNSAEFNVTRSYLDWLTAIPWGRTKKETFDVDKAMAVLDEAHYGMNDVKERILEFIAVGKLVGSVKGRIVCFVGPPGVGKTSIASSIAKALGRDFARFSVGGLEDVAEIKGHRRTYVGAMPGKPVQALKSVKSFNPLILLDEIDKLGVGRGGDPASALLELLDPSQNANFLDHYLDVPIDMSQCLFICTANVDHTIPPPLLDRMEIIRLAGYDLEEKVHIAQNYLLPRAFQDAGLVPKSPPVVGDQDDDDEKEPTTADRAVAAAETEEKALTPPLPPPRLEDGALRSLVRGYAREAGVRSLQKLIEKIARKLALKRVRDDHVDVVDESNLEDLVGKPRFMKDRLYEGTLPPGAVCGLAWTPLGGSTLYIEAAGLTSTSASATTSKDDKKTTTTTTTPPRLTTTGQLGSVMEESSRVAMAHVRSLLATTSSSLSLDDREIHVHVPEGATPKDGPSAGVTIATALVSLASQKPVNNDLAMTGELSLNGRVLPVGGIKEKVIAARRAGVHTIVLPDDNRRDLDELPDYLKTDLTFHFAATFHDVLHVAFAGDHAFLDDLRPSLLPPQ